MLKKVYRTIFVTIFLMSIAMPAIPGSVPADEKIQQRSEQTETEQIMEHTDKEMKELAQIRSEVKGGDQQEQETGQEMLGKHENPQE